MQGQDYEIIQRVLTGEKRAFAELVDRHKDKAMTLAVKMLRNREDAEEALQDAFVRTFKALPRFEWKASFSTWFYRIVYNCCATMLAKRGDEKHDSIDEEDENRKIELESDSMLPDIAYESREFQNLLLREIARLPEAYGATFTLFFVQELSYEEIVEVTGLPIGTIKARLFRARSILRIKVARHFRGEAVQEAESKKEYGT